MSNLLGQIVRLRRLRARAAQMSLIEAQTEHRRLEDAMEELANRVDASHAESAESAAALARHHAFALRSEMQRRRQSAVVTRSEQNVLTEQDRLAGRNREQKAAERMVELRLERELEEQKRVDQKQLDEIGALGWWRGRTS